MVGALVSTNEVAIHRERLLQGWATVRSQVNYLGM